MSCYLWEVVCSLLSQFLLISSVLVRDLWLSLYANQPHTSWLHLSLRYDSRSVSVSTQAPAVAPAQVQLQLQLRSTPGSSSRPMSPCGLHGVISSPCLPFSGCFKCAGNPFDCSGANGSGLPLQVVACHLVWPLQFPSASVHLPPRLWCTCHNTQFPG